MSEVILNGSRDGATRVEVFFAGKTYWLTQRRTADLFSVVAGP
jgi:hypothetical protein